MFDREQTFWRFALFSLIGCLSAMVMGGGLTPLIAAAVALVFLRIFYDHLPRS